MARKRDGARAATDKADRLKRPRGGVTEILYDRVTGRSQEVTILPLARTGARRRITFTLHANQRTRLEELREQIRRKTGAKVSSSMIVRGVLDALADVKLDLSDCMSEADVRAVVQHRLSGG